MYLHNMRLVWRKHNQPNSKGFHMHQIKAASQTRRRVHFHHQRKTTTEGDVRPTLVTIRSVDGKITRYQIPTDDLELAFLDGLFPVEMRPTKPGEDLRETFRETLGGAPFTPRIRTIWIKWAGLGQTKKEENYHKTQVRYVLQTGRVLYKDELDERPKGIKKDPGRSQGGYRRVRWPPG